MNTALITGISSDLGQATKMRLEAEGWNVVGLTHAEMDLADPRQVKNQAAELKEKLPNIDAIIHFAGIWHTNDKALAGMKLSEFTSEQIEDTMNVGLTSFMVLTATLLPNMSKAGAIIAISGTYESGGADWLPYYVSKRGLEDFLVGLAEEHPDTLRVFGISPSDTNTRAYARFYPEYAAQGQLPQAVADLAAELINGKTSYKSGDIIKLKLGERTSGYHQ